MGSLEKIVLISAGDPASIAPEITVKAIQCLLDDVRLKPIVISNPDLIKNAKILVNSDIDLNLVKDLKKFSDFKNNCLNLIPLKIPHEVILGKPNYQNSSFVINSIQSCVKILNSSIASAIVTNPISKNVMHKAGFSFDGHTDYLESLSVVKKKAIMMLVTEQLKTVPLTIHVPLRKVPLLISKDLILNTIKTIINEFNLYFGISKPRILITGLNPHAGENGDIGLEENEVIIPAIKEAKKDFNCSLIGPVSADSAFAPTFRKLYDVAICMYHDQALIPIKTIGFHNGVNVTLGIDFIRTSPDHGTGFDIAGKNIANPESLIASIKLAYEMSLFKENGL